MAVLESPGPATLELDDVSYRIQDLRLLAPLSLRVEAGSLVGLIGPNGSGKSTLMKLMAAQLSPTQGSLRLEGRPMKDWGRRAFARRVAYLGQDLPATEGLTARELVRFGRFPWRGLLGRRTRDDEAQVERAMALTGTQALAGRVVETLSGGERQRVWLAMLLAQESRFLLLDEPLSALDVAHQVEVMDLIRHLSGRLNLGVVVILHDINIASRYCDRIVALNAGQLALDGSPEELMREDALKAIYSVEMQVMPHPLRDHTIAVMK